MAETADKINAILQTIFLIHFDCFTLLLTVISFLFRVRYNMNSILPDDIENPCLVSFFLFLMTSGQPVLCTEILPWQRSHGTVVLLLILRGSDCNQNLDCSW